MKIIISAIELAIWAVDQIHETQENVSTGVREALVLALKLAEQGSNR